jgi:small subunit ribosomal protein S10e
MMVIAKKDIKTAYTYLLKEGVAVVKKDSRLAKHPDIPITNLEAMNIMKSLKSRGYVTEEFNWQHHYYYLTDDGILFLRNYLHVPETVIPATLAKAASTAGGRTGGRREEGSSRRQDSTSDYRRGQWRDKPAVTA